MATLRIESRDGVAQTLALGTDEVTIGRGAGNTLHFRDPWLSRVHARIVWRGGAYQLEDTGSRNGTFLNGRKVGEPSRLVHGDQVALGDLLIHFLEDASTSFEMPEGRTTLSTTGTVMISSDELNVARYRQRVKEQSRAGTRDLSEADDILPTLNEVAAALITHYPLAELVEVVLDMVFAAVPAERGALLLRSSRGTGELEVKTRRGYDEQHQVRISRTIVDVAVEERQAILTVDAQSDERFDHAQSIMMQGIRSVLCVPMSRDQGEVIGLIYLDHRIANDVFSERTLRLVGLIASLAAVKIENCWLLEDQIEKRRLEEQLAVGAQIQRGLLPAEAPEVPGYDLCGVNRSCFEIGGDYFDFLTKEDGKIAVVIGDISGKGVPAALLMAVLQASIRALIHAYDDPAELMGKLNQVLVENSPDNKFSTLFYAELDPENHTLDYASGGHNPTLLWTPDGGVEELGSSGPIVGLVSRATFTSRRVDLPPGSTLLFYTDGVTELQDGKGGEFGEARLHTILRENAGVDARELIDLVHGEMQAFVHSDRFDDDSTLVVLRRLAD